MRAECAEAQTALVEGGEGHRASEDELMQGWGCWRGGGRGGEGKGKPHVGEGVYPACARCGARFVEGPFEATESVRSARAGGA